MNLRHLRYFAVLAETKNFRRAAELLHISQPALSRQIQMLEAGLDTRLFERMPRGTRLTEAGSALLGDVAHILELLAQASERTRRVARGQSGTLRVGLSETGAVHDIVHSCLRQFHSDRPGVELVVCGMDSAIQFENLRKEKIDAGFIWGYGQDDADFDRLMLHGQSVLLAIPEAHPLAQTDCVTLSQLQDQALIWMSRSANEHLYDAIQNACLAGGLTPRIVQAVSPGAIVLCLVSIGMGLGLVLSEMPWRKPKGIVFKRIVDLDVSLDLHLVWRRESRSPLLKHFVETAKMMMQRP